MGSRSMVGNQGSGNLHSFIDGIRLRLSDKYQPPKRISLPPEYVNRLQEDIVSILDLDYDFRREEEVVKSYQAESAKSQSSSWPTSAYGESQPDHNNQVLSSLKAVDGPSRPAPPRPPPPKAAVSDNSKECSGVSLNPLFASVSYRPLEPQKATKPSGGAVTQSSNATNNGFRAEDFEPNSHNPFDNLELKSLNDMEELQHVLAKDRESS